MLLWTKTEVSMMAQSLAVANKELAGNNAEAQAAMLWAASNER